MAKFKIIASDPTTGKSQVIELEGSKAAPLIGRKIGEIIDGAVLGISGKKLQITGGSDKDGFPMRPDVHGGVRTQIVIAKGVGFKPVHEGERRRKTLRGNTITEEIVQINMKILEASKKGKEKRAEKGEEPLATKESPPQQQNSVTEKA